MKKLLLCSICSFVLGVSICCGVASNAKAADQAATKTVSASSKQSEVKSALSQVASCSERCGAPQDSIETAQKYVKDRFFYSTREGDKFEGEPLIETIDALKKVKSNRVGYFNEVVSEAYGKASEELTTGAERANKTLENLTQKATNAETYDDKKAVGVLLAKTSMQERTKRLSLDLALLELEAVAFLNEIPENYVIARTADEIDAEMKKNIQESGSSSSNQEKSQKSFLDEMKDKASEVATGLKDKASSAMDKVSQAASDVKDNLNTDALKTAASSAFDTVSSAASKAVDDIKNVASSATEIASGAGLHTLATDVKNTASEAMDKINQTATDTMDNVSARATEALEKTNKEALDDAANKVSNEASTAVKGIENEAKTAIDKIQGLVPTVAETTAGKGEGK